LSNSDEGESNQDIKLLMAYEKDKFMDALKEEDFVEEITQLKICLEEKKYSHRHFDTSTHKKGKAQ